jgi:hypothetical protein
LEQTVGKKRFKAFRETLVRIAETAGPNGDG